MKRFSTILLVAFGLVACSKKNPSIKASYQPITESVYASGSIIALNQYQVYSTVNGIFDEQFVVEGDTITAGMPMFRLFNESSKLNKENAELAAQFSDYNNNKSKINELLLAVELAAKKLQQDSLLYKRQLSLWQQNIGTKLQLEQTELNFENSKTAYESAILRLNDTKRQLSFSSNQSKKNLQISSRFADDYLIKSDINGKVYNILKKKGELITPQTPIALVGDANRFIIQLQIDEYDIVKVQNGQKVFITLDSYKGSVFEATVTRINPIMNERTKTFLVEATFVKQPPILYPNLTVEANIVIKVKEKVLTIPRQYLINDSFVMNAKGDKIQVTTGLKDYKKVEILSGITENDEITLPK